MFGTFIAEDEQPIYGLVKNIKTNNPIRIAFHEWTLILKDLNMNITLIDKLKYIFYPPGWSHDGSRKTSNQLREEINIKNSKKI